MIRAALIVAAATLSTCAGDSEEDTSQPLIGNSAVEAARATCEADGGRFAKGGLAGTLVCYHTPPDAGKSCETANDCTTECLARTLTCAPVTPLFGCNDIIDSSGRLVALCRD